MIVSVMNGKNVLVVDDDPDLRTAIAFDFTRRGCKIFLAASGDEAIEIVRTQKIDIVVSDVRMPNGTGVELLAKIRKIDLKFPIVILTTGFADLNQKDAIKMGACDLLEKPIDRKLMFSLIEKAIA